jgi:hypothetical protein
MLSTHFPGNLAGARLFCERLPSQGRILVSEAADLAYFRESGFQAETFDASEQKIGFFRPEKEAYDGIWVDRSLFSLPTKLYLRTTQIFFSALKPKGLLFISFLEGLEGPEGQLFRLEDYASMLRQCGFEPLMEGRNPVQTPGDKAQIAILARRI